MEMEVWCVLERIVLVAVNYVVRIIALVIECSTQPLHGTVLARTRAETGEGKGTNAAEDWRKTVTDYADYGVRDVLIWRGR